MGFDSFRGNSEVVRRVREMLKRGRLPHALILAGPEGSGKYTLAQMLAKAMNCLAPPAGALPDFCGMCANCTAIAEADDLPARFAEAVAARDELRESDRRETRVLVQTHPNVLIVPPDPPQMLIKVDQVRQVIGGIYFRPEAGRRVYIFPEAAFMKEAANALLKVLEEPPEFATLLLLVRNPGLLLPTIRSRCVRVQLAPLAPAEVEREVKRAHPEWGSRERELVARLAEGAIGRARSFDLAGYKQARQDAMTMLSTAVRGDDHSALFRVTENYRAGAEGKEKTERLLSVLFLLLEDLLFLQSSTPELVRNTDIRTELARLAAARDFDWVVRAAKYLGEAESGMRRNLLRSLSLDAVVARLEGA